MSKLTTLVSLAMLKARQDLDGSDHFDSLVPFVSFVIQPNQASVSAGEIQAGVAREFGLSIPQHVIELVLRRMTRRRFLRKEDGRYLVASKLPIGGFEIRRAEARRRQQVVISKLVQFAQSKGVVWTVEQAVDVLLSYLSRYSIDCLRAYARGSALPDVAPSGAAELYLVNAFIRDAHQQSSGLFNDVICLVESQMLANALTCDDLASGKKFTKTTFFFDAPLILEALGLDGPEAEAVAKELLQLLKNLKGKLAVFQHTIDEIEGILHRCVQKFSAKDVRAPLVLQFRKVGKTASDLVLARGSLHEDLEKLGIKIEPTPRHLVDFQIDEGALEESIRDEIAYWNEQALLYDIQSIRSVYTLRGSREPRRLEDAGAVFVTTNVRLARVAFQFGRNHENSHEVASVISDSSLANFAWLKSPLGAPALPRLEVLASCYAALKPSRRLLNRFIDEVERLERRGDVTAAQLQYLRSSAIAQEQLVDLTMGDERRINRRTVEAIVHEAESHLLAEERARHSMELGLMRSAYQSERDSHAAAARRLDKLLLQRAEARKSWYWFWERAGRFSRVAILVLSAIVAAALAFMPQMSTDIPAVVVVLGLAWDFLGRMMGGDAWSLSKRLEAFVRTRGFRLTTSRLGLRDEEAESREIAADVKKVEAKSTAA